MITIYIDNEKLELKNISVTDYKTDVLNKRKELEKQEVYLLPLNLLKGNKELLRKAFLNQKVESLNL
jgi:hypothetical protein